MGRAREMTPPGPRALEAPPDKGKPVERPGRKAMGLQMGRRHDCRRLFHGCQAAEGERGREGGRWDESVHVPHRGPGQRAQGPVAPAAAQLRCLGFRHASHTTEEVRRDDEQTVEP